MSKTQHYCKTYRLPEWVADILKHLPECYWWLLSTAPIKKDEYVICKPGYYSGYGKYSKRMSLANDIKLAATRAGKEHRVFNVSKRNGITGLRILINA